VQKSSSARLQFPQVTETHMGLPDTRVQQKDFETVLNNLTSLLHFSPETPPTNLTDSSCSTQLALRNTCSVPASLNTMIKFLTRATVNPVYRYWKNLNYISSKTVSMRWVTTHTHTHTHTHIYIYKIKRKNLRKKNKKKGNNSSLITIWNTIFVVSIMQGNFTCT